MAEENDTKLRDQALEYLRRYKSDMDNMSIKRKEWHSAYMREPYDNEMDGRSQVVMSDVADTIHWILPSLMRVFYGSADVVRIEGIGEEDAEGAELLHEKVNFDIQTGINGFILYYDWFFDACKDKYGVVKWWWETETKTRRRAYEDLTDQEFQEIQQKVAAGKFVIEKMTSEQHAVSDVVVDPGTGVEISPAVFTTTYNVEGRETETYGKPMAMVVPGSEFIFNITSKDLKDEDFVCHRIRKHKAVIAREYGIKEDDINQMNVSFESDKETVDRFKDLGGVTFLRDTDKNYYFIHECVVADYSSGNRVLKIMTLLGDKVVKEEVSSYGEINYEIISPQRISHRVAGMGLAELITDLQKVHTSLARFTLDNIYYQTNGMSIVDPLGIELLDFEMNNKPGGLVRTKNGMRPQDVYTPMPVRPLSSQAFAMEEKVQLWKENRTGVTRYVSGSDINVNRTATGVTQLLGQAQQRIELIARIFAETGVKDLMRAFAKMNIDYLRSPAAVRINNQWKTIRPDQIDVDFDVRVDVGLGTGSREAIVQQMMTVLPVMLNPTVIQSGVFKPNNLYEVLKIVFEQWGYKAVDRFLTKPPSPLTPEQQAMMAMQQGGQIGPGSGAPAQGGVAPAGPEGTTGPAIAGTGVPSGMVQ